MKTATSRRTFRAMGTDVSIVLAGPKQGRAEELLSRAEALFHQYEEVMTRFRVESELSRVNRWSGSWVQVSPLLFDVIQIACLAARHTNGLFDPTIGATLAALGYDRTFEAVPGQVETVAHVPEAAGDWSGIELDARRLAIRVPRGVMLDLGGIGKGYTADTVAAFLAPHGAALVDAGGDIRVAGTFADEPGWRVAVASPFEPRENIAVLRLADAGCATSTTANRRWQRAGQSYHHIIDPRINRSAETDLASVTVVAPSAAEAEIHAKVALLSGKTEAALYFAARPAPAAILVTLDGQAFMTETMEQWLESEAG